MIYYQPGIHGFVPMRDTTETSLWGLWNSHPEHPYLSLCCAHSSGLGGSLNAGIPDIIFASPTDGKFTTMNLEEAEQKLDHDALSKALLATLSDRWITEFAEDFQRATSALNLTDGYLSLHVMPGCLMLQHIDPASFVCENVQDDWHDEMVDLWNLGVFAAGPTETSHEKIAAIAAVKAVQPAWQQHVETINQASPAKLQVGDPAIHPGRQWYSGF